MNDSIAKRLEREFDALPWFGDGYVSDSHLIQFLKKCKEMAINVAIDCPNSFDSSIDYTMKDGSILHLANPRQALYPAVVVALIW